MPSFGGSAIFGIGVTMATADNPRADQKNAFPGLSGVETLDHGLRGRFTDVSGWLVGNSPVSLDFAEIAFRSFNDGVARPLVDNYGNTWYPVKLETFQPEGRIRNSTQGFLLRAYKARFFHL